jgi:glucose-1-phosphate adenylyltransferase
VGTLDAYFETNLDLTDTVPMLNMYDRDWRIWTDQVVAAPAKFVHDDGRRGHAIRSLISQDCIVSGATAYRSLLFTGVKMGSWSEVNEGVILPYCNIGRHAKLARHHRFGCPHSRRAGGGRRPRIGCQAFPAH